MAVDRCWDINVYHNKFEPKEHWELKQEFLLAHKENIPEDKLVSLAQVYVNMELLGCRYSASVSNQVRKLSKGLGANYRDSRQNKLQRTFVEASDAVLTKLRRESPATSGQTHLSFLNREEPKSNDMGKGSSSIVSRLTSSNNSVLIQQFSTLSNKKPENTEVVHGIETDKLPSCLCSKLSDQQAMTNGPSEVADPITTAPTNGAFRQLNNNRDESNTTCDPSKTADLIDPCGSSRPDDLINPTGKALQQADPIYTGAPSTLVDPINPTGKALQQGDPNHTYAPSTLADPIKPISEAQIQADLTNAINRVWKGKDPLAKLILINRSYCKNVTAKFILNHSVEASDFSYSVDFNPQHQTYVAHVNRTPVESVPSSIGLEAANEQLAMTVLDNLCQRCCMLEVKKEPVINSQLMQRNETGGSRTAATEVEGLTLSCPVITNDNVGYKMLKMMGWSEGGLGKNGTGRTDPIEVSMMRGRKGLGYNDLSGGLVTPEFKEKITMLIRNFIRDVENRFYESEEFLFSSNLSGKQLKFIHSAARQSMLKSKSCIDASGCYIVLTLDLTVHQKLLRATNQGSSNVDFAVYLPGTYSINIFNLTPGEVELINDLRSLRIEGDQSAANYGASQGEMIGWLTKKKAGRIYANRGPSRPVNPNDNTSGPSTQAGNIRKTSQVSNPVTRNYSVQKEVHVPFSTTTCKLSGQRSDMTQLRLNPHLSVSNKTTMDLSNTEKLNHIINVWGSDDPMSKLILINLTYCKHSTPHSILISSFSSCGMTYTVSTNTHDQTYVVYVNKAPFQRVPILLGKKAAKEELALAVLENLCLRCCLLEVKKKHCKFSLQNQTDEIAGSRGSTNELASQLITDDNINSKMLKTMGTTEGALGKDVSGRVNPIEPSMMCEREELNFTGSIGGGLITPEFKEKTMMLIRNFIQDLEDGVSETGELKFSPRLSNKQRLFIHTTARKLKLNSKSYGEGSERFLVLGEKLTIHQQLLQALRHGSSNDKFEVHLPGTYNPSIFRFVRK